MSTRNLNKHMTFTPFIALSLLAIVSGGVLSAFFASSPSQLIMWTSAYLVLVAGITQLMLGIVIKYLTNRPSEIQSIIVCIIYNLSCGLIILGTIQKSHLHILVPVGSILLLIALIGHIKMSLSGLSRCWRPAYVLAITALIVSILVGNLLSFS